MKFNEDLGKAFYEKLTEKSGTRLIDFEDFNNNTFNVVTELTYKKAIKFLFKRKHSKQMHTKGVGLIYQY